MGFVPKLNQIREGKEGRQSRSRASSTISSTVSSTVEPRTRRRRKNSELGADRSQAERSYRTLQRHASPLKMATPSTVSEVTQESGISNDSNTTVTQRSYDAHSDEEDSSSEAETYVSKASESSTGLTPTEVDAANPDVFQFMHQTPTVEEYSDEETHVQQPTIVSSSEEETDDSEHEGTPSSNTGSSQFRRDTPTTSPASVKLSNSVPAPQQLRKLRHPKKPLYASSFVHGHGGDDEEQPEESEESEEASEEENDEGDEDHNEPRNHSNKPGSAMQKTLPPRVPSGSSRHSDPHTRRLRQQEQELANHVLQSPQPQKDFQFAGGPSPHPHPSMPLYSPHAYSGASPTHFEPTAGYSPEWPHFPPPLPIGYPTQPTLESPTASHAMPLTVQPPLSAPSAPGPQHVASFHQYPGQPPQYQAHVPAPDMSRTTAAGYELLANKLSETPKKNNGPGRKAGNLVPMYRKFEHLNHRVLLHLQDEVCELEEELRYLDESIIQMSPRDDAGHTFPASRRGDARYGSELHYKRTELLGRIFQKLGQYSKSTRIWMTLH